MNKHRGAAPAIALLTALAAGLQLDSAHGADRSPNNNAQVAASNINTASLCLDDSMISYARQSRQIWFDRKLPGGAHTSVFNGAEVLKALNAYCGDTRLDAELLVQIRYLLIPNRGPTATGGYQDQKQLGAAFTFLLAKQTVRIWKQLTDEERSMIDLDMEAHLYATAFTTKDGVASPVGIDGNTNHGRDWNPNHQNGMIGMIIMTALYWGFDDFEAKLSTYNHEAFVTRLRDKRMANLLSTFENPSSPAPSVIEAGLKKVVNGAIYTFHGISERDLLGLLGYVMDRTFSATVNCGLNRGLGVKGYGKMVRNCTMLPNIGLSGMLMEFASADANGQRSSANYSYDSWYPLNYSRAAMQIFNVLEIDSLPTVINVTEAGRSKSVSEIIDRSYRGVLDLYFKISPRTEKGGGYLDYSKGEPDGTAVLDSDMVDHRGGLINLELFNMLQRKLGKPTIAN